MTPSSPDKPTHFSAQVPFSGFYGTIHDHKIDEAEEQMFSGDDGRIISQELYEMFFDNLNYGSVHESYAKTYVAAVADAISIPLDYEEMTSPREYNFMTDRLFAKVSRSGLAKMLRAVRGTRLNQKIKQCFTSCDGFISHYPNHISRWPRIAEWDHNHVGTVLACYVDKLRDEDTLSDEVNFLDDYITSEDIEHWLDQATIGDSESQRRAARALKLSGYLRRRAERKHRTLAPLLNP